MIILNKTEFKVCNIQSKHILQNIFLHHYVYSVQNVNKIRQNVAAFTMIFEQKVKDRFDDIREVKGPKYENTDNINLCSSLRWNKINEIWNERKSYALTEGTE